jgi:hypothetical protein
MKARAKCLLTQLLALLLATSFLLIAPENNASAQDAPAFTQQELDQMLAPIALYPDALLSQITMAATYPLEVVEAERWSVANPNLRGTQAVQAVEQNNWDPSVKSLVAFPQILRMMNDKLDWTERLGDAFLGQEQQVMDTIQDLRHRAYKAGNLRSNDQARVESQGDYITIDQADPQVAYEPYYNPSVVYGSWWWPQYPPVYWAPWPGYRERPGFGAGFAWGVGITLGAEFFYGAFDWRQHRVDVVNVNNYYYPRDTRVANRASSAWQHDPDHRRGAPYREAAVRAKFNPTGAPPQARSNFRGHVPTASEQRGEQVSRPDARVGPGKAPETRGVPQPAAAAGANRPDARAGRGSQPQDRSGPQSVEVAPAAHTNTETTRSRVNVPETNRSEIRPAPGRPSAPAVASRAVVTQAAPRPHALENVGQAAETRNSSARGRASSAATAPAARPVPVARPAANVPAPRPPERAAAPSPPPRAAAPRPAAAAPRAPEKDRERR